MKEPRAYARKPLLITAIQWLGDPSELPERVKEACVVPPRAAENIDLRTFEGVKRVYLNDYIIFDEPDLAQLDVLREGAFDTLYADEVPNE